MTRQRSLGTKTRFLTSSIFSFAVLTVLIAFAAPAQQSGTGQPAKSSAAPVPAQANPPLRPKLRAMTPDNSLSFLPAVAYGSGGIFPGSVTVADVNGDGKPDLLVANLAQGALNHGSVGVLLGNGDGTFQAVVTYDSGDDNAVAVVVADVNGDGKPDLLVANLGTVAGGTVGVLLGNGDGTFQAAVIYGSGGDEASSVAVADVNGDGKPDLVVANCSPGCQTEGVVSVLLGNGNGTFQTAASFDSGGSGTVSVAVADVSGDGKPDLVVANQCLSSTNCTNGTVGVLLGNGNATFQPVVTYGSGGSGRAFDGSVTVADINGDGKPDVLVANTGSSSVGVLLGNGDGTFQASVTYSSGGTSTTSVATADVNGDGKPDLLITNQCAGDCGNSEEGSVGALLGNGDGTFQLAVTYDSGGALTSSVAVADVNGDGKPDILVANLSGTVAVLLNNSGTPPTATDLVSNANPARTNQLVTYTATVKAQSGGTVTGTVTFRDGGSTVATVALAGNQSAYTTSYKAIGTHLIVASYSGDLQNAGSTSPSLTESIVSRYATLTALVSSLNPSIYGQKVTWTATVTTSGSIPPTGMVNFTWGHGYYSFGTATLNASGVATLTRSMENADTYALTAVYSGDANNLGSTSAALNQVITEATSSATLASLPNPSTLGQSVTFTATISSPTGTPTGPVTFAAGKIVLGTAQLAKGKATFTTSTLAAGSTKVTATYYGDSNISASSASVVQIVH